MHELTNKTFGKLKVLKIHSRDKHKHLRWLCKCECGNEVVVLSDNLLRSHTTSCGCERIRRNSEVHRIHGKTNTREYVAWINMLNRCEDPKNKRYDRYGGRGISVCEKWHTFNGFWEDMEEGYAENLTIDRINGDGNYQKSNCKWSTITEQANNTSTNRLVTVDGITDTVANLCRRFEMKYTTAIQRLSNGWSADKAFKTPRREVG